MILCREQCWEVPLPVLQLLTHVSHVQNLLPLQPTERQGEREQTADSWQQAERGLTLAMTASSLLVALWPWTERSTSCFLASFWVRVSCSRSSRVFLFIWSLAAVRSCSTSWFFFFLEFSLSLSWMTRSWQRKETRWRLRLETKPTLHHAKRLVDPSLFNFTSESEDVKPRCRYICGCIFKPDHWLSGSTDLQILDVPHVCVGLLDESLVVGDQIIDLLSFITADLH